eukprot:jgi/Botrbrau1/16950/Bobra.49_2s0016.3
MLGLHVWLLAGAAESGGAGRVLSWRRCCTRTSRDVGGARAGRGRARAPGPLAGRAGEDFFGSCLSYDKALRGEADLKEALLRNVYGNDAGEGEGSCHSGQVSDSGAGVLEQDRQPCSDDRQDPVFK